MNPSMPCCPCRRRIMRLCLQTASTPERMAAGYAFTGPRVHPHIIERNQHEARGASTTLVRALISGAAPGRSPPRSSRCGVLVVSNRSVACWRHRRRVAPGHRLLWPRGAAAVCPPRRSTGHRGGRAQLCRISEPSSGIPRVLAARWPRGDLSTSPRAVAWRRPRLDACTRIRADVSAKPAYDMDVRAIAFERRGPQARMIRFRSPCRCP